MNAHDVKRLADRIRDNIHRVMVGKTEVVDHLLIALLSGGHVLLEDVPGTGKTLLAKTLARSVQCAFRRVQFTPDLLPSDLTGVQAFNKKTEEFEFRPGPLFAHLVLADEINRATPRTQSSLLECMEERQISIDGTTHSLPQPFMVIATQNPVDNQGTFPLPEAQLDRFLLKIAMGYPSTEEGVAILDRFRTADPLAETEAVAEPDELASAARAVSQVKAEPDLLRYIVRLAEQSRNQPELALGISPRATQALLRAAQARAAIDGRGFVLPDDIKAMAKPVWAHRIVLRNRHRAENGLAEKVVDGLLAAVPVPTEAAIGAD
ncbi:AAA family ATPase [Paenibacillus thermoaerophilus]|uniref:AAA family ATPase n=1 Tax=Paenibacillus thermoaerophilus TaxID=1215385 RepID=A0ABW2V6C3_9BACL|nr:MoxR family ATPase [Paenibacillus thermoaerophilus]TMV18831.1 MoxR family ATPase [Paenibacillus thermoaerophilus]